MVKVKASTLGRLDITGWVHCKGVASLALHYDVQISDPSKGFSGRHYSTHVQSTAKLTLATGSRMTGQSMIFDEAIQHIQYIRC